MEREVGGSVENGFGVRWVVIWWVMFLRCEFECYRVDCWWSWVNDVFVEFGYIWEGLGVCKDF